MNEDVTNAYDAVDRLWKWLVIGLAAITGLLGILVYFN